MEVEMRTTIFALLCALSLASAAFLGYQYAYYEMISAPPTYHTHTENRV